VGVILLLTRHPRVARPSRYHVTSVVPVLTNLCLRPCAHEPTNPMNPCQRWQCGGFL
jgi:hypothetical protein